MKRNQDCSNFHVNSFNSLVQTLKCEVVVPLVKSFPVCPPYRISYQLRSEKLIAPTPSSSSFYSLNFQSSNYSLPAILSCCLGKVSQGSHKATSLSSVSSSVKVFFKMFFRYPQKILTASKLWDHDTSCYKIFCCILFCYSPILFYFFMELEWVPSFGSIFLFCVHKALPQV